MEKSLMSAEWRGQRAKLLALSAPYGKASRRRSTGQLALTLVLWAGCYATGMALLEHADWMGAFGALTTSVFVVRLFMIQHDCGHRSYWRSKRANDILGGLLGILTMTPYKCWRRFHAAHHGNSGNLDRRGLGDIATLTTREFNELTSLGQLMYRVYRHPVVLLLLGPPLLFILRQRTTFKIPREWKAERQSVHATNGGIVLFGAALCWIYAPSQVVVFHLMTMCFASIIGVGLFYVQHQFPDAYWKPDTDWESWRASMEGASYFELPGLLRWLTANIGLHHIHHLDARIPNYKLYECYMNHAEFSSPHRINLRDSLACLKLRLYDPEVGSMVPFPRVRALSTEAQPS